MSAAKIFLKEYKTASLNKIYAEHVSITSAVGIDRLNRETFESRLQQEIDLISRKVNAGKYNFSQYKEKLISKGAGKIPRVISIPTFRDRITLRALCNVLRETHSSSFETKLPQHTISLLKDQLNNGSFNHFIKLDVTNFYPSIDHELLISSLKGKIRKATIIGLVESAIKTATVSYPDAKHTKSDRGVPQGLSISNVLAEIYLSKFDTWIKKNKGIYYLRYVDDILILTKSDPAALFANIQSKLDQEYKLNVHGLDSPGKSSIGSIDENFQFLGYQFQKKQASIKIESIRRIETSLAKIFTTYKYRRAAASYITNQDERQKALTKARAIFLWRLNLRITGCLFDNVRRGWVFYFSKIDDSALKQLHHLDKTVKTLFARFNFDLSQNEVKLFSRSYHESERASDFLRYIPNFDTASVTLQRKILEMYGIEGVVKMSDEKVEIEFRRRIRRETSELELDIQGAS